ncbi:MAG TPA: OB-fold domain-containing protein [Acidimicrobiales bacterium]|nr:OB-fold domain-containing protein [Acidimicrobiales bacterium]
MADAEAGATFEAGRFDADGLLGGACATCDRRHFPQAAWCPWCGAPDTTPVRLSTDGTLWAWTAVTAPPAGYEGEVPYGFGVVELPADGLRVVTRLTVADPAALSLGQPMAFTVETVTDGVETWAFGPA